MHEYIKEKVKILADFGLTDKHATAKYLTEKCEGITDKDRIISKVDFEGRKLINEFLDGNRKFVKYSKQAVIDETKPLYLYNKLKKVYAEYKVMTLSEIIAVTGKEGFRGIQSAKYIKRAGTIGKEKVFKFNR